MLKYKDFDVRYKEDSENNGVICGYASTFDRVADVYGDVVAPGAFKDCLARLEAEQKTIPFVWAHRMDDINAYLGKCVAHEDEKGLYFEATLDNTPEAQRVRELFKDGRLSKFSFAYSTLDEGPVTLENGMRANELRKLDVYEITACLVPANSFAEVTEVKAGNDEKNDSKDGKEEVVDNNVAQTEDLKLLNLQKFDLLQLIKKLEKNTKN